MQPGINTTKRLAEALDKFRRTSLLLADLYLNKLAPSVRPKFNLPSAMNDGSRIIHTNQENSKQRNTQPKHYQSEHNRGTPLCPQGTLERARLVIRAKVIENQIMAASAIIISSDSSDESVGSPPSRVILFGDIPTVIPSTSVVAPETSTIAPVISPAAPMVETTLVASPTGLCGLVPYTGSDSDSPDEMSSPEHISPLPAISPFICTDSSEAPDSSDGPPLQDPYVTTIARWRSRVTARPSSSHEFPIAPVTAPPGIRRRKRVGPLPARRLASRHASPRSPDHHSSSSSSSSDSSPVHSLGLDASDQAHSGSSTRDVSPRLSPVNSVPLSMPVTGSLAPTRADLSPPRKRFRDSYSSEASLEEDAEVGLTGIGVDMELGISDGDEVGDHVEIDHRDVRYDTEEYEADASAGDTAEVGIDPMTAPLVEEEIIEPAGEDSPDSSGTRDGIVRSVEDTPVDLSDVVCDFYHHMSEVRVDRIETAQRRLEADQLIASGDRARMAEAIYSLRLENLKIRAMLDIETMTNTRSGMTHAAIEEMINQRVNAALEAYQVNHNLELGNNNGNNNGNGNGNDNGNGNGNNNGNGNGNDNGDGNENGDGNGNNGGDNGDGNENPNVNGRGGRLVARECTYQDFMKCQPTSFKGTKGVVGLIRWSKKMETVFHISNCPMRYKVKYATCTLLDSALTWWNSHKRTIGTDAAYAWNFTMMCSIMVPEEGRCVENFIGVFPLTSKGNVIAADTYKDFKMLFELPTT
ncbi:hypothetical protein Tco_0174793 [Tanacetum coccineum]